MWQPTSNETLVSTWSMMYIISIYIDKDKFISQIVKIQRTLWIRNSAKNSIKSFIKKFGNYLMKLKNIIITNIKNMKKINK